MSALAAILEHKRREVNLRKEAHPIDTLSRMDLAAPDFGSALQSPGISAIGEMKRRSPSLGAISEEAQSSEVAQRYRTGGAAALSILTDERFFGGRAEDIASAKRAAGLPALRKDFIVDPYQLHESRHIGADAVLLIVAVLGRRQLGEFIVLARDLGLAVLVETHTEDEVKRAVDSGAAIIGVNNRDLTTMRVDLDTSLRLRLHIPETCLAVAESGIRSRSYVIRLEDAGYDAMLVGGALMVSKHPERRLMQLLGHSAEEDGQSEGRLLSEKLP